MHLPDQSLNRKMRGDLERWEFGDPADVAEARQNRTCAGCRHIRYDPAPGYEKILCFYGMRKAVQDLYETDRCPKYSQKEAASKAAKKSKRPYSTRKDY